MGFSVTAGGFIFVTGSLGFHLDSHGNLALFSPSLGGGALLPGAAEAALFYTETDADFINPLEGFSMVMGGSIEAEGSAGGEAVFFKDTSTGQKCKGGTVTLGAGAAAPIPGELHIGVNYTWVPLKINLYDLFDLPQP